MFPLWPDSGPDVARHRHLPGEAPDVWDGHEAASASRRGGHRGQECVVAVTIRAGSASHGKKLTPGDARRGRDSRESTDKKEATAVVDQGH
jgi:hypothetical protein